MVRSRRGGEHGDLHEKSQVHPFMPKAPWYFEATLKQELNRRRFRRERLRRYFRRGLRLGAPGAGLLILAIVAVAGFQRGSPTALIPAPLPDVAEEEGRALHHSVEATGPVQEKSAVSDRATEKGATSGEVRRREEKSLSPESVPASPVTPGPETPTLPVLSLAATGPQGPASSGTASTGDSLPPADKGSVVSDSSGSPADSAGAGIDSSKVSEQHSPSPAPER